MYLFFADTSNTKIQAQVNIEHRNMRSNIHLKPTSVPLYVITDLRIVYSLKILIHVCQCVFSLLHIVYSTLCTRVLLL